MSKLFVLTGPSGVGKDTILTEVRSRHPELYISVSATTRAPRTGEVHGREYYFLSGLEFEAMIGRGELYEWACYVGNYYGTPKQPVLEQLAKGRPVLLEIEVQGALQVREHAPEAILVFIRPPTLAALAERLARRGTDDPEVIARRLRRAEEELALADRFDYQVVNDDLPQAIAQLEHILFDTEVPHVRG